MFPETFNRLKEGKHTENFMKVKERNTEKNQFPKDAGPRIVDVKLLS